MLRIIRCAVIAAGIACVVVGSAEAETPPEPGAVALPDGFEICLPFPDGVEARVTCGYGCSSLHQGTDQTCCSNDYHALDLVRNEAGGGNGKPLTAIASGTVTYADWTTDGWSSYGRLVMIEHDFDADGHAYQSVYAHLSSIAVGVGEHVDAGQEIGNMGGSSDMMDDIFGYHVHLAVYQDGMIAGGPYGGHAVVPEPIGDYEDILDDNLMIAGPCQRGGGESSTTGAETGDSFGDTGTDSWGTSADSTSTSTTGDDATTGFTSGTTTMPFPGTGGNAEDDSGCACRASQTTGSWLALLLPLLLRARASSVRRSNRRAVQKSILPMRPA